MISGTFGWMAASPNVGASIAALFAGGAPGVWYEPGLTWPMRQDILGSPLVTAGSQPVGFMPDKRMGLQYDADVLNGGFDADSVWTKGEGWVISSGVTAYTLGTSAAITQTSPVLLAVGDWVEFTYSIVTRDRGFVYPVVAGAVTQNGRSYEKASPGTYTQLIKITTITSQQIGVAAGGSPVNISVDNLSVRRLRGSHAAQATAAARPVYATGPDRLVFDGIDDAHITTFPTALGSNCTVARAIPGVGAQILTGQNIGTSFTNTITHAGMLIVPRPLTPAETAAVTAYLKARAGL